MSPSCALFSWLPATLLLLALVISKSALISAHVTKPTVFELLDRHGFPPGLLPDVVADYDLKDDGKFTVYLEAKCSFMVSGGKIPVYYASKVTGVLDHGMLKNLVGIQAQAFKMWWSITGIEVKKEDLVLKSGFTTKTFPRANFEEVPGCDGSLKPWRAPVSAPRVAAFAAA